MDTLEKLALNSHYKDTRVEATNKLKKDSVIKKIAVSDNDWEVRYDAVKKFTSENELKKLIYM